MNIIRKRELIRTVAERWHKTYCFGGKWRYGRRHEEIYEQLLALGEDATEEQVADVIGNRSWTATRCHECGRDVDPVLHLGEEPDYYDAIYVRVCPDCLRKAEELIEEGVGHVASV